MAHYPQIAIANSGDRPGPDVLEGQAVPAFGEHPHHNIFAIPILNHLLIYAPLHSLAALVDHTAALRLRDSLLSGKDVSEGQLGEIVRTFNAAAEPAPSPKQSEFAPAFLGLLPTRSCNLACRYCGFLTLDESQKMMDLKLARDAVNWYMDLVTQASAQQAEIHFFGGEPFCAEEVLDLAVHLARMRARETGSTVRFEVATNGTFSQQRCQWAADHLDSIVLSLDGPAEIQDTHRPRRWKWAGWSARGEDCLALGTIADGVFGDYHYRHPEYMAYCRSVSEAFPALQGGLRRTNLENRLHLVETAILSGGIPSELLSTALGEAHARKLLRQWQESALIAQDTPHGHLRLTANGSWFAGNMLAQLSARSFDS